MTSPQEEFRPAKAWHPPKRVSPSLTPRDRGRIMLAATVTGILIWVLISSGGDDEPAVRPTRLEIPSLDIEADMMNLGLESGGDVELPPYEEPGSAGWYKHSAVPGDEGAAVIIGHVDTRTAPAVFYRLTSLRKGAKVKVARSDGKEVTFKVEGMEKVHKDRFPRDRVYGRTGYPSLRLVTCGGRFDRAVGEYDDNIIVYARAERARRPRT